MNFTYLTTQDISYKEDSPSVLIYWKYTLVRNGRINFIRKHTFCILRQEMQCLHTLTIKRWKLSWIIFKDSVCTPSQLWDRVRKVMLYVPTSIQNTQTHSVSKMNNFLGLSQVTHNTTMRFQRVNLLIRKCVRWNKQTHMFVSNVALVCMHAHLHLFGFVMHGINLKLLHSLDFILQCLKLMSNYL
jgi:hypothetical protein